MLFGFFNSTQFAHKDAARGKIVTKATDRHTDSHRHSRGTPEE
jgi:hypothetical protein